MVRDWQIHRVSITRTQQFGLGLAVTGGIDTPNDADRAITVSDVLPGGPAQGKLIVGDRLLSVNGTSLVDVTHGQAIQQLKAAGETIDLVLNRRTSGGQVSGPTVAFGGPARTDDRFNRPSNESPRDLIKAPAVQQSWPQSSRSSGDNRPRNESPRDPIKAPTVQQAWPQPSRGLGDNRPRNEFGDNRPRNEFGDNRPRNEFGDNRPRNESPRDPIKAPAVQQTWPQPSRGSGDPQEVRLERPDWNEDFGLDFACRLEITKVAPGSVAQRAGLRAGDVVAAIDGVPGSQLSLEEARDRLKKFEIRLRYIRDPAGLDALDAKRPSLDFEIKPQARMELNRLPDSNPKPPSQPPTTLLERRGQPYPGGPRIGVENGSGAPMVSSGGVRRIVIEKDPHESTGVRLTGGNSTGIFIAEVRPDSVVSRMGLVTGDKLLKVNGEDMTDKTHEDAVIAMVSAVSHIELEVIPGGKEYQDFVRQGEAGDSFFVRVNFSHPASPDSQEVTLNRGDVFHVRDTLYGGVVGRWQAIRVFPQPGRGTLGLIPNRHRAEQLALKVGGSQTAPGGPVVAPGPNEQLSSPTPKTPSSGRLDFTVPTFSFSLKKKKSHAAGLCSPSDHTSACRAAFPPYERVVHRFPGFVRPVVILGPLSDMARNRLTRQHAERFECPSPAADSEGTKQLKLSAIKEVIESGKHCVLDITPAAVERLIAAQYAPIVIHLQPQSRNQLRDLAGRYTNLSWGQQWKAVWSEHQRLTTYWGHLFSEDVPLNMAEETWFNKMLDVIKQQQYTMAWMSERPPRGPHLPGEDTARSPRPADELFFPMPAAPTSGTSPGLSGWQRSISDPHLPPADRPADDEWQRDWRAGRGTEGRPRLEGTQPNVSQGNYAQYATEPRHKANPALEARVEPPKADLYGNGPVERRIAPDTYNRYGQGYSSLRNRRPNDLDGPARYGDRDEGPRYNAPAANMQFAAREPEDRVGMDLYSRPRPSTEGPRSNAPAANMQFAAREPEDRVGMDLYSRPGPPPEGPGRYGSRPDDRREQIRPFSQQPVESQMRYGPGEGQTRFEARPDDRREQIRPFSQPPVESQPRFGARPDERRERPLTQEPQDRSKQDVRPINYMEPRIYDRWNTRQPGVNGDPPQIRYERDRPTDADKYPDEGDERNREVVAQASGRFDSGGGRLEVPSAGVTLIIPPGALPSGKDHNIFIKVFREPTGLPGLDSQRNAALMSPLVMCGPAGLQFLRPVRLLLPHRPTPSSDNRPKSWDFSLLVASSETGRPQQWSELRLGGAGQREPDVINRIDERTIAVSIDHF